MVTQCKCAKSLMTLNETVLQDNKKSFEGAHFDVKTYCISPASL